MTAVRAGAAASDEDDLFDWDPKATRLKEKDQHVGRKRGRAFVRESKSPSHLGGRQKKGAARDAAGIQEPVTALLGKNGLFIDDKHLEWLPRDNYNQ